MARQSSQQLLKTLESIRTDSTLSVAQRNELLRELFAQLVDPNLPAVNETNMSGKQQYQSLLADYARHHFGLDLRSPH